MAEIVVSKRSDGSTFEPVLASNPSEVYIRGEHKPSEPRVDPRINTVAALYPKVLYRLMDGVEPFTDANEFNRALGHAVGHDPKDAREAPRPKIETQRVESTTVKDEVEEQDAIDEGFGPISACFANSPVSRTRKTKLEAEREEFAAREAAKDAELAELRAMMQKVLEGQSASQVSEQRGRGRPPSKPVDDADI